MEQNLSLEGMPAFLLEIGNQLARLEKKVETLQNSRPEAEPPIDIHQAARFVMKEVSTLYNLVAAKKIPFHKDGKRLYFFKSELEAFIKSGGRKSLSKIL